MNPINLLIRFLLEVTALFSLGLWGWRQNAGGMRYLLALGLPIIMALVWGTFAVPKDPSRSGEAPIIIPGILRLAIELTIFAIASWVIYDLGNKYLSLIFLLIVAIHYIASYDRIHWLFEH